MENERDKKIGHDMEPASTYPKGANNRVLGPKDNNIHGIWAPKPYYLDPWTLRNKWFHRGHAT